MAGKVLAILNESHRDTLRSPGTMVGDEVVTMLLL
jgi:hypothetical protein